MFSIRTATVEDADALAQFARRIFFETFAKENTPEDMERYVAETFGPALQRAELLDAKVHYLLLQADGRLAGYTKLARGEANPRGRRPLQVCRFYLDSPWHGSGAANSLMEAVLALAQREGNDDVWLGVWEHNLRAIRFYQKHGFTRVGEQPCQVGEDVQTDWVMARSR